MDIKVPSVGESISSGVIAAWHKKHGEFVNEGEPLFSLDTDKISTEINADASGTLEILVPEGKEVEIGQVIGILHEGEPHRPAAEAQPQTKPSAPPQPETQPPQPAKGSAPLDKTTTLSPAVRRMVTEGKIDPASVPATGRGGRLTKADVIAHQQGGGTFVADKGDSSASLCSGPPTPVEACARERVTRQAMSPMRRKIAEHLLAAKQNTAMLTTFHECDMSSIMAMRKKYQEAFQEKHGVKLGFMSFFIKAVVDALQAVPNINARIDGCDLIVNHYYDIGVAVSTDKGLVVPVVRNADSKTLAELEQDVQLYAKRAKESKITLDEMRGGVFTITNGGIFGSLLSTPILNPPQSAILGMHTIQERPVAMNGEIVIRPMMYLALSYDHRVVDGKEGVTFLVRVKNCIENPERLLLNI